MDARSEKYSCIDPQQSHFDTTSNAMDPTPEVTFPDWEFFKHVPRTKIARLSLNSWGALIRFLAIRLDSILAQLTSLKN